MSNDEFAINQMTIREMAKLSMVSNKLNEFQMKNLKTYPFVFFNGVNKVSMTYNLENNMGDNVETVEDQKNLEIDYNFRKQETRHFKVSYDLNIDPDGDHSHIEKRYDALEKSVRNLLWNQITVEIYFNGELKYKSK